MRGRPAGGTGGTWEVEVVVTPRPYVGPAPGRIRDPEPPSGAGPPPYVRQNLANPPSQTPPAECVMSPPAHRQPVESTRSCHAPSPYWP